MILEFVRLVEHNDHEGEKWTFWLQYDDNQIELAKLGVLLEKAESEVEWEFPYELILSDRLSEVEVDLLVEFADDGYMPSHNKVTGKFICPHSLGKGDVYLYKGGIQDLFHE